MEETREERESTKRGKEGHELRVVRIDCNPGPDAQDRLRPLFTLLVRLAAKDSLPDQEGRTEAEG